MGKTITSKWNSYKGYSMKDTYVVAVRAEMQRIADQIIERAIRDVAQQVLDQADQYVPELDGDLRATGRVDVVEKRGKTWYAEVVYGDSEINYAFFVHEDIPSGVEKTYSRPGSGPFYLQRAGDEVCTQQTFREALQKATKEIGA